MLKQVEVGNLLIDIENLGQPYILVQMHGFLFKVKPDDFRQQEFELVFFLNKQSVCRLTILDLIIREKTRPDNYLVECEKCYGLYNERGEIYCTMFWLGQ